tara:strand:+ start:769 stop:1032 length:264 start_codon:yes stop_codon:yes gene_type:complete
MTQAIDIIISPQGEIRYIYNDALLSLTSLGAATIKRASHVEPCDGGWQADLGPVNGPILGPFTTRQEALQQEVNWLLQHNIPQPEEA